MKTPQQEALSLAEAVAEDIYNQTEFAHLGSVDKTTVIDCVAELPLAELIAVARTSSWLESKYRPSNWDLQMLTDALHALRATGKVDGIWPH